MRFIETHPSITPSVILSLWRGARSFECLSRETRQLLVTQRDDVVPQQLRVRLLGPMHEVCDLINGCVVFAFRLLRLLTFARLSGIELGASAFTPSGASCLPVVASTGVFMLLPSHVCYPS